MTKLETHEVNFEGHKILSVLDHATASDILAAARQPPPTIPQGCNTFIAPFVTSAGKPALVVNQTRISPEAKDNECEVNGYSVLIAQDIPQPKDAWPVLHKFVQMLLT